MMTEKRTMRKNTKGEQVFSVKITYCAHDPAVSHSYFFAEAPELHHMGEDGQSQAEALENLVKLVCEYYGTSKIDKVFILPDEDLTYVRRLEFSPETLLPVLKEQEMSSPDGPETKSLPH